MSTIVLVSSALLRTVSTKGQFTDHIHSLTASHPAGREAMECDVKKEKSTLFLRFISHTSTSRTVLRSYQTHTKTHTDKT